MSGYLFEINWKVNDANFDNLFIRVPNNIIERKEAIERLKIEKFSLQTFKSNGTVNFIYMNEGNIEVVKYNAVDLPNVLTILSVIAKYYSNKSNNNKFDSLTYLDKGVYFVKVEDKE